MIDLRYVLHRVGIGEHAQAVGDRHVARDFHPAAPLDLDAADAAVSGHGKLGVPAEVGNVEAVGERRLQDALPALRLHRLPVYEDSQAFERSVEARSLVLDEILELVAEFVQDAARRVAGGVAHAADRRAVVPGGDLVHARDVLGAAFTADDAIDDAMKPPHPSRQGVHCPQDSWW
jgi:hypothetical protein